MLFKRLGGSLFGKLPHASPERCQDMGVCCLAVLAFSQVRCISSFCMLVLRTAESYSGCCQAIQGLPFPCSQTLLSSAK